METLPLQWFEKLTNKELSDIALMGASLDREGWTLERFEQDRVETNHLLCVLSQRVLA
jgi:hypothetical protein